jgi:Domain of unknown function (DUF4129)
MPAASKGPATVGNGAKPSTGPPSMDNTGHGARVLLAILLLAVVIVAVRAGPAFAWPKNAGGPLHAHGFAIGIALEVTLAALLAALGVLSRRRPVLPGSTPARLRGVLGPVILLAMIAGAVALIRFKPPSNPKPIKFRLPALPKGPKKYFRVVPESTPNLSILVYVLLAVLVLLAIAIVVILLRRGGRRREPEFVLEDDEDAILRKAAEAGRRALGELTEARMAIIACYLAMEHSLAEAGAARGDAETPDELLSRASVAGFLRGGAPAELTSLFYEARFSTHPVPPAARDAALRALDAILADLDAGAGQRSEPAAAP